LHRSPWSQAPIWPAVLSKEATCEFELNRKGKLQMFVVLTIDSNRAASPLVAAISWMKAQKAYGI
jgi:hypothetical protein